MRGDLVLIEWLDHSGGSMSWTDIDNYKHIADLGYKVKTVGFVVQESRQRILVVQSWAINDMVNHHMTIEKKLITSLKLLKKAKQ